MGHYEPITPVGLGAGLAGCGNRIANSPTRVLLFSAVASVVCSSCVFAEREYVVLVSSATLDEACFEDLDCSDPSDGGLDFAVSVTRDLSGDDSITDSKQDCAPVWETAVFGGAPVPIGEILDYGLRVEPGDLYLFGVEFGAWETFIFQPDDGGDVEGVHAFAGDCASVTINLVKWDGD